MAKTQLAREGFSDTMIILAASITSALLIAEHFATNVVILQERQIMGSPMKVTEKGKAACFESVRQKVHD